MEIKKSELNLVDFGILDFDFKCVSGAGEFDFENAINNYKIDIDFGIKEKESNTVHIFTKISINYDSESEKFEPGYSIFAEGMGIFTIEENPNLSEPDKKHLIKFSGVPMVIGCIRNAISNFTGICPFGRYLLPSIDLQDLFLKKKESIESKKRKLKDK